MTYVKLFFSTKLKSIGLLFTILVGGAWILGSCSPPCGDGDPYGNLEECSVTADTTSSGGSGGGSDQTTIQEVAQATYIALRYSRGKDLVCHAKTSDDCITLPELKEALKEIEQGTPEITAEDIDGMTPDCKQSCMIGAIKIYKAVNGSNWKSMNIIDFHQIQS